MDGLQLLPILIDKLSWAFNQFHFLSHFISEGNYHWTDLFQEILQTMPELIGSGTVSIYSYAFLLPYSAPKQFRICSIQKNVNCSFRWPVILHFSWKRQQKCLFYLFLLIIVTVNSNYRVHCSCSKTLPLIIIIFTADCEKIVQFHHSNNFVESELCDSHAHGISKNIVVALSNRMSQSVFFWRWFVSSFNNQYMNT